MDHLGAPLALGLGLPRDRAHHRLVQVDVLDLDVRDLDPPRIGLRIQHLLDIEVELFPLGQHLVQFVLAEHRAQRGLRELAGGLQEVRHLDDRQLRIDHAEIHHRVHLDRHVVVRDHVLRRHVHHHRAQVYPDHLLHGGNDQHQARALHFPEAPEHEDHAALVLAQHAERRDDEQCQQEDQTAEAESECHVHAPLSGVS
ncbi:hypothetical protein D9M69_519650 [compost metagenome]